MSLFKDDGIIVHLNINVKSVGNGGEKGIRTLDTIARIHAFQACAFNHSAISPTCNHQLILQIFL